MDDTDIKLCQILFRDSRMPVRDLADGLGISVQAVHRRIQLLKEMGVLHRFKANISTVHLNAVPIYLMGLSSAVEYKPVMDSLKGSEFTSDILVSGDRAYFAAGLYGLYAFDLDAFNLLPPPEAAGN